MTYFRLSSCLVAQTFIESVRNSGDARTVVVPTVASLVPTVSHRRECFNDSDPAYGKVHRADIGVNDPGHAHVTRANGHKGREIVQFATDLSMDWKTTEHLEWS